MKRSGNLSPGVCMRLFPVFFSLILIKILLYSSIIEASSDNTTSILNLTNDHYHARDWSYRTEGGRHLILEYIGEDPSFKMSIMRIKKPVPWADDSIADYPDHLFVQDYIKPHASVHWFPTEHIVAPDQDFYHKIFERTKSDRPPGRIKPLPDIFKTQASIQRDIMSLSRDGITIEIKPKSAVIPSSPLISPDQQIKKEMVPFHLMQLYKLFKGKTKSLSTYDPTDLYSKNRLLVKKALRALFKHPQNNLRIFQQKVWIDSYEIQNMETTNNQEYTKLIQDLTTVLTEDPALDFLKKMQSLDTIDTEGAWKLIHPNHTEYFTQLTDTDLWKKGLWDPVKCPKKPEDFIYFTPDIGAKEKALMISREQSRSLLQQYLIAAAAKDCSILIHLYQPKDLKKDPLRWDLSIVDIGKKSIKKIAPNYLKEKEVVAIWKKTITIL